jgi:hypothetical protein
MQSSLNELRFIAPGSTVGIRRGAPQGGISVFPAQPKRHLTIDLSDID